MSKATLQKITVRQRRGMEGRIMTGASTQIFLDGVPLKGAVSLKFEVHAAKVAKVTIEMFADVEIEGKVMLKESRKRKTKLTTTGGKAVARYNLSSYSPVAVDKEED